MVGLTNPTRTTAEQNYLLLASTERASAARAALWQAGLALSSTDGQPGLIMIMMTDREA